MATRAAADAEVTEQRRPRSERLDAELDPRIHAAAMELLGELGYDGMSIEAVAARAGVGKASIYRRWSGKPGLVLDAVLALGFPVAAAPDTGALRDDLLAVLTALQRRLAEGTAAQMAGLLVAIRRHPELATAVREGMVEPWQQATAEIVGRAVEREEIPPRSRSSIELFSQVIPSMLALQLLMPTEDLDDAFSERFVDETLLPILRHGVKPSS